MTDEKTYTPEEEARLANVADAYFASMAADAKRYGSVLHGKYPDMKVTVILRHEGGHAVVVTDDDHNEVVAAIFKANAKSKN